LFFKSVISETVRKSAGREFHAAGPEKETGNLASVYIVFQVPTLPPQLLGYKCVL